MSKSSGVNPSIKLPSRLTRPTTGLPGAGKGQGDSGSASRSESQDSLSLTIDDFTLGERVWVGGMKEGSIAFLGRTQFAEGDWAGVILDEPVGKNDGTVNGVRYFECQPQHGLFSRLSNLKREAKGGGLTASTSSLSVVSSTTSELNKGGLQPTAVQQNNSADLTGMSRSDSGVGSAEVPGTGLRVGDRIHVSGGRPGTLRFLGPTEFAKGDWAGVELDDSSGKNDGSVGGKRYFACKPNYGLFAPIHKVSRAGVSGHPGGGPVPPGRKSSIPGPRTPGMRSRSGSQESLNSVTSNMSSASRSRVRLGVTAISGNGQQQVSQQQKVLKEKEEHIEQLLKERDMERSDVARAANQVDEAEAQYSTLKANFERYSTEMDERIRQMSEKLEHIEREKKGLAGKLEEEKRKVEDLQFQIEEETIDKSTLETKTEEDESKIFELEEALAQEKDIRERLEKQMKQTKEQYDGERGNVKEAEDMAVAYLEQVEQLQTKLSQMEGQLRQATEKIQDDSMKKILVQKDVELDGLRKKIAEAGAKVVEMENKLANLEEEKEAGQSKREKQEAMIKDLEEQTSRLEAEKKSLQSHDEEMVAERSRLEDSVCGLEAKNRQLLEQREALEKELAGVMSNAGDSSQQLAELNQQLRKKEAELQSTQDKVTALEQQVKRLNEEMSSEVHKREEQIRTLGEKNQVKVKELEGSLQEMTVELETAKRRVTRAEEGFAQEKASLMAAHEAAQVQLTSQLRGKEETLTNAETDLERSNATLEEINAQMEETKRETTRLEQALRRVETEKVELIQAKRVLAEEKDRLTGELREGQEELSKARDEMVRLGKERDLAVQEKHTAQKSYTETKAEYDETKMRLDKVNGEKASIEERMERTMTELRSRREDADNTAQGKVEELEKQVTQLNHSLSELQRFNEKLEVERTTMNGEVGKLRAIMEENAELLRERDNLEAELENIRSRISEMESNGSETLKQMEAKSNELRLLQDRLIKVSKEHDNLQETHRSTVSGLEHEKRILEDKLRKSERQLDESEKKAKVSSANGVGEGGGGNSAMSRLQDAKENAERQISFLNSVIVDLQNKNVDLEHKIQLITDTQLSDLNGDDDYQTPLHHLPPRLYCDICELFDTHDTDDCPLQAGGGSPSATRHGADRGIQRAYCEICETFGHDTANCNDEQTF